MSENQPFNPGDPFDVACEAVRLHIGEAAQEALLLPEMDGLSRADNFYASVFGTLMASVALAACTNPESDEAHIAFRKMIVEQVPFVFDQVRGIMGLDPLPRADQ